MTGPRESAKVLQLTAELSRSNAAYQGIGAVRGVKLNPDRAFAVPETLRYSPLEEGWGFRHDGCSYFIRGAEQGPAPARLDTARLALGQISEFVREANEYLAAFVVPERFDASGPWDVIGADFGRAETDSADTIDVLLAIDGDIYGLWSVRFRLVDPRNSTYHPIQFGRRQYE